MPDVSREMRNSNLPDTGILHKFSVSFVVVEDIVYVKMR
jgi:hypothetical protein